jgi:hypothetical protein
MIITNTATIEDLRIMRETRKQEETQRSESWIVAEDGEQLNPSQEIRRYHDAKPRCVKSQIYAELVSSSIDDGSVYD